MDRKLFKLNSESLEQKKMDAVNIVVVVDFEQVFIHRGRWFWQNYILIVR